MVAHWDWDTITFDGSDRNLIRRMNQSYSDWQQDWMTEVDPWMGRRLWKLCNSFKKFEGEIRCYTMTDTKFAPHSYSWNHAHGFRSLVKRGMLTQEEFEGFLAEQKAMAARGEFFFSLTIFAYVGRKLG